MPRGYLKEIEYRESDINAYIRKLMKENGLKQKDVAEVLRITQQAFSKKLKHGTFTINELLTIFRLLKADSKNVGNLFSFEGR